MQQSPPRLARWLLERCIIAADRDAVLGDLCEEFEARSVQSPAKARAWFRRQALRSLVPALRRRWPAPIHSQPQGRLMDALWQDLRFSLRQVRQRPAVSLVAAASLIVGMSLVTVVFSLLNAIVLRPLPVRSPSDLVVVLEQRPTGVNHNFSYPEFQDFRASQKTMVDMAASSQVRVSTRLGNETVILPGELVSGSYFNTLGVPVSSGRPILESDDRPGQPPVVVVSERLWRQWGRAIPLQPSEAVTFNETSYAVVGLVPDSFTGLQSGRISDVWIPAIQQNIIAAAPNRPPVQTARNSRWLDIIARRKPGVTDQALVDDLVRVDTGMAQAEGRSEARKFLVEEGSHGLESMAASAAPTLKTLFAAAFVVLLVACANVANLLMARVNERRRELAMRMALGASRLRLVRLLFVEALVLGGGSAIAALLIANAGATAASSFLMSFGERVVLDLSLDTRMVLFTIGLGLAATIVSSLTPVLHLLKDANTGQFADGSRSATAGRFASRARTALLVVQFALSLVLVVTALLLVRTVWNLRSAPTGYAINEVALLSVSPRAAHYDGARTQAYLANVGERLQREPGVRDVGFARVPPVNFGGSRTTISVMGYMPRGDEDMEINFNEVAGDYFGALGIPILDGQALPATRSGGGPIPSVINSTMARRYWTGKRAVGQNFYLGADSAAPLVEVVGVVADAKYRSMREEVQPSFYLPLGNQRATDGSWHVRVAGNPDAALPALRRVVAEADSVVPITRTVTLRGQQSMNITNDRLAMSIGVALAAAAILLAGVGLFGAMSQLVGQRTREIGVRLALGASPPGIGRLVLGQAMGIALAGSAFGLVLAVWATSFTAARLYGVGRFDPISFAGAALVLTAVAVFSAFTPARRASRVDPVNALRHD
jgi:predicted permease